MKLLFDQNLSPSLVETLREIFPESLHVQSAGLSRANCSTTEIAAILLRHIEDVRALERDEQALFLILV